ncbi:hypothetical protein AN639_12830 [Candidatus Epulonipiscium fishelsonii]|uniref:Uncharacterized protein n=1 Tax=Candidatus Epulonipiscium fishelsonii TaxID=77094 RepID=A0ACC8XDN2_9FIRM|nr:hypothetical protein AN396_00845 [Epulopiscium sp. SCG-B11WGA-EpuloA1]ONI42175.1 hypothetical protein AN639_12830 [Epulopiscium sp. SCG-B05WGA-EpuloA1]
MINLRPHHLLCTQFYRGNGYSNDFVKNMDYVTSTIRSNEDIEIKVVYSTDDLCTKCPSFVAENHCSTNEKVKEMDSKIVKYFNIQDKTYNYKKIISDINKQITYDMYLDICDHCQWFDMCASKELYNSQNLKKREN